MYRYFSVSARLSAGHSKWANIRHIKAAKDGAKSLEFSKYSRRIRIAIQENGGITNPSLNSNLSGVIDDAIRAGMPSATIQNAIKRFEQQKNKPMQKHVIQVKGLSGFYSICVLYTDNIAGVKMQIGTLMRKHTASYENCRHLFEESGVISCSLTDNLDESKIVEDAITIGCNDVEVEPSERYAFFLCNPEELTHVEGGLRKLGYNIENIEHLFQPKNHIDLNENQKNNLSFIDKLLLIEGVEHVFHNIGSTE